MKLLLKLTALFFVVALVFLFLFFLFGEKFELLFSFDSCLEWFSSIKSHAWMVGILLLLSDILLPVPATGVIAALGAVYGLWPGFFFGVAGSAGAGIAGYGAARFFGTRVTRYIASQEEMERFRLFFNRWGGYAIIISRILPLLPEVMTILAGFSGMGFPRFAAALFAGTLPVCFLFSWMGQVADAYSGAGVVIAVVIPALIWPFFLKVFKL